jgi:uncharacterized protein
VPGGYRCSLVAADLSIGQARRLALASLGFGRRRPAKAGATHVRATAQRLSAIQIDSVNVLARAHYLPVFSRYGPYPTAVLDDLVHGRRELFEYWGHAACFLPIELYPYLRWRMDGQVENWGGGEPQQQAFIEAVFAEVAERGPLSAGEIPLGGKSKGAWWGWSDGKRAVELLFRQGRVAIAGRRNFERLYDIPERVFPPEVLKAKPVPAPEAKKELLVRAVRAMGVGTARDVALYFHVDQWWDRSKVNGRRPPAQTHLLFDELVEDGHLEKVTVEGWKQPGYVVPGAKVPRSVDARAIVSPFDPVLWERRWTKAVFGFDYQIEIYVPAPKRIYGYYVLPFLMGEGFSGRVDLKADRKTSNLLVQAAYAEAGADPKAVAEALAGELHHMARWLGLEGIKVAAKGDLAEPLIQSTATQNRL